ncbi:MAG: asparagine synthetase B family protein [Pseudomonadota bacterium]
MSGIGGIVYSDGQPVAPALLEGMLRATPFHGPDGRTAWSDGPVGLIRLALWTTPESVGEVQPHLHAPTGAAIVFDGRIDNRPELLALLGAGAPPSHAADGEIVLAAHLRFGDAVVDWLAGDYAFAIWTPERRRLFCARAPTGWRPFLWTRQGRRFAFATEPATLIRGLGLAARVNEGVVAEHLASRFVSETDSLWDGIERLPPGHALALEGDTVRTWRWHEGPFEDLSRLSEADHVDRFLALLDQSLIATMRSAGPVVSQLSGGLDSSTVVCRIQELVRTGRLDRGVEAVSARFPGEHCDEGEWIAAVEAECAIRSDTVQGETFESATAAAWCAETLHLPLRPNTAGTIVAICDRLRDRGVRVLLTGEGGDDWMNGSRAHWPDLLTRGRWPALFGEAILARPDAGWPGAVRSVLSGAVAPLVLRSRRERLLRPHLDFSHRVPDWIDPDWARRVGLSDRWRAAPSVPALGGFAQRQRYHVYALARRHVNLDNVICLVGSRGVELRHPLHDLRLTRFLMGAAGGLLRRGGVKKHLLREAMRGVLPEVVRTRTSKANISAPIIDGVQARIAERPFDDLQCVRRGWVDGARLKRIHDEHLAWRRDGRGEIVPQSPYSAVWNAVAIDLWLENAIGL